MCKRVKCPNTNPHIFSTCNFHVSFHSFLSKTNVISTFNLEMWILDSYVFYLFTVKSVYCERRGILLQRIRFRLNPSPFSLSPLVKQDPPPPFAALVHFNCTLHGAGWLFLRLFFKLFRRMQCTGLRALLSLQKKGRYNLSLTSLCVPFDCLCGKQGAANSALFSPRTVCRAVFGRRLLGVKHP